MRILFIVGSLCLCVACGKSGPLYLPEQPPQTAPASPCDAPNAPCRKPAPSAVINSDASNADTSTASDTPTTPTTESTAP